MKPIKKQLELGKTSVSLGVPTRPDKISLDVDNLIYTKIHMELWERIWFRVGYPILLKIGIFDHS